MDKAPKISIQQLLVKFPEIELPVILSEEEHHTFSAKNDPIPEALISHYLIAPGDSVDEFTEFVACFSLPDTENFHAIVFWRAGLLTYEYILQTFSKKGQTIDRRIIGGTKVHGNITALTVATIEEGGSIIIAGGVAQNNDEVYDATTTESIHLELLPNGQIVGTN